MSDKRIQKLSMAISLQTTALMQMDRKAKPHEVAYALIKAAYWVMEYEHGVDDYLTEVVQECAMHLNDIAI